MSQQTQGPDARYSTSNTNLAACIGSLKIPVKSTDPVTVVRDSQTKNTIVSFWFEDVGVEEFCGQIHSPRTIERYWNNRESFEKENPGHPLVPMRAALDALDWLIKAWHGRIMPAASLDKPGFLTQDLALAACLKASGYSLIRLDKPRYAFRKIPNSLLEDFRDFEQFGAIEKPIALMHRALEARRLLVETVKHAQARIRFTDGQTDADGGRMALIPEKATDEEFSRALDHLYKP